MRLPDDTEWDDMEETTFYGATPMLPPPLPAAIPLMKRITPVKIADGVVRRPLLTLEFRDLLVAGPWMFAIGVLGGLLHLPIVAVCIGSGVFGVLFDRVLRRWV